MNSYSKKTQIHHHLSKEKVGNILGVIGTIIAILMFFSLLEIAHSNWIGQSNIVIQPLITMINCSIWSVYAIFRKEKFVFWANIPGVFLGLITVLSAFVR
jgi:hypothetical protein